MGARESTFRGYWAIVEVMNRVGRLGEWMKEHRPACKTITLQRKDHDLLCRWPKAAALCEVEFYADVVMWKGFVLRADTGPSRYGSKTTQDHAEIK